MYGFFPVHGYLPLGRSRDTMATLTVQDHTAIVEFCLRNRIKLRGKGSPKSSLALLQEGVKLAKGDKIEATLISAVAEIKAFEVELRQDPLTDKVWAEGLPVLSRVAPFRGSVAEFEKLLRKEANNTSGTLKITLNTTADILADGAQTIYNPEQWILRSYIDPRSLSDAAGAVWAKIKEKAEDVVSGDVAGAIIGGLAGAVAGGVKGGTVAAGKGALDGAIKGAVAGSAKSAAGV